MFSSPLVLLPHSERVQAVTVTLAPVMKPGEDGVLVWRGVRWKREGGRGGGGGGKARALAVRRRVRRASGIYMVSVEGVWQLISGSRGGFVETERV